MAMADAYPEPGEGNRYLPVGGLQLVASCRASLAVNVASVVSHCRIAATCPS
jgi:hypothetical protein